MGNFRTPSLKCDFLYPPEEVKRKREKKGSRVIHIFVKEMEERMILVIMEKMGMRVLSFTTK